MPYAIYECPHIPRRKEVTIPHKKTTDKEGNEKIIAYVNTINQGMDAVSAFGAHVVWRGVRLEITKVLGRGVQGGRDGKSVDWRTFEVVDDEGVHATVKWNGGTEDLPVGVTIVTHEAVWRGGGTSLISIGHGKSVGGEPGGLVVVGIEAPDPEPPVDDPPTDLSIENLISRINLLEVEVRDLRNRINRTVEVWADDI